jgi:hypothetical protein
LEIFDKYDVLLPVYPVFDCAFGDQLVIEYDFFGVVFPLGMLPFQIGAVADVDENSGFVWVCVVDEDDGDPVDTIDKYDALLPVVATCDEDFGDQLVIE